MKKIFIILLIILIVVIAPLMMFISDYREQQGEIKKFNLQYEEYKEGTIRGVDIASLINSAVDNNERYEIKKDEKGKYVDDNQYCIRIELVINSVTNESQSVTYAMEDIYSLGMDRFVKNFNLLEFECENISYNSIGKVSKITFKFKE